MVFPWFLQGANHVSPLQAAPSISGSTLPISARGAVRSRTVAAALRVAIPAAGCDSVRPRKGHSFLWGFVTVVPSKSNQIPWKSMKIHENPIKIHQNPSKSIKIHQMYPTCDDGWPWKRTRTCQDHRTCPYAPSPGNGPVAHRFARGACREGNLEGTAEATIEVSKS